MKHIKPLLLSILMLFILVSPSVMAANATDIVYQQDIKNNYGSFYLGPSDFIRTSAFVQGYADYLSQTPTGYVTMTVTSNNPDGVVTYTQEDLSLVVPYFGLKTSYFIMPSTISPPSAYQYYSNKLWSPTTYGGSYIANYPFDPGATGKVSLALLNINTDRDKLVAADTGYDRVNLIEDHGLLRGFGKHDPSTMYIITLQKHEIRVR